MKHILGLALFSFIVSATAIIYAFFNVSAIVPAAEVTAVSVPQSFQVTRSCKMKLRVASVEIRQAIYDVQTKQFNWELATPEIDEPIALHFFSKNEKGTHYIMTESVNNKFSHNGILRYGSSYNWLNERKSHENLYVLAEFEYNSTKYGGKFNPQFDAAKATAVTIDYGE